jgi:hypothetical protein
MGSFGTPKSQLLESKMAKSFIKMRHAEALGDRQNVGLATCFKDPENTVFYPYNKPNIDFLGLSMPINKG